MSDDRHLTPRCADPGAVPARGHYTEEARLERLRWAREHSGAPLRSQADIGLEPRRLAGNVENLVGAVSIPVGLAGPLHFTGEHASGWISAPMATTEGALVASASRGASAISRAGGVSTQVLCQRMTRAPLYELSDLRAAQRFVHWVVAHTDGLRRAIREVSQHAELVAVEPLQIGRSVHLRLIFETADAAGQNMTTACAWRACHWINERVEVERFYLDGNSSGDKKLTGLNLVATRGTRVTAECRLDDATLRDVLKVDARTLLEGHQRAVVAGQLSGMVGYNVNVANVVAAIFTATGQDIACVHESSAAVFSLLPDGDGVYASVLLPGIAIGTVGGGTGLPAQHDFLDLVGAAGDGGSRRLAEVIAGFALALDLSTCAAMCGGQFADAHERLGRNRPVQWFTREDLHADFLSALIDEPVTAVAELDRDMEPGAVSEVAAHAARQKLVGIVPLRLEVAGRDAPLDVVVKSKALDEEIVLAMNRLASLCGGRLAETYSRRRDGIGFKASHVRELELYRTAPDAIRAVMPHVYGVHADPEREAYLVVLEHLNGNVLLKDSARDARGWTTQHVDAALRGIAGAHAVWLGREEDLLAQPWLGPAPTAARMAEMAELWQAIADHGAREFPAWVDDVTAAQLREAIAEVPSWWAELEAMPRTLVHNDFSPRNIALRRDGLRLVAYDWELATLHVPQRDLAELLTFVLPADVEEAVVLHHLEVHRRALEDAAGVALDPVRWRRGYRLALRDFLIGRLGLFLVAHSHQSYDFLDRVVPTARRLIDIERDHEGIGA